MFMVESLFADFTVVKVIAYTTLVSNSNDWRDTTAITGNILVLN